MPLLDQPATHPTLGHANHHANCKNSALIEAANKADKQLIGAEYRLGYRPEIEGLRAVAILLVVAAHSGVPWLAGGFVGVDVFFVLSGYLITGLLVQELHTKGTISLTSFYARRLMRLMPALLLMIAATAVLARLLLSASQQAFQAVAAAAASLWASNIHFAFQIMDYFSPGSESNLFLHTWSLGVEEQFYIIWPLLLAISVGPKIPAPIRGQIQTFLSLKLFLTLITSFALGLYWLHANPTFAFYMMPARAWQFALGALVFVQFSDCEPNSKKAESKPLNAFVAGWIGLVLILAAAATLNKRDTYPGMWAVIPSVGAALALIPSTNHLPFSARHLLATKSMQWIGKLSYSWYLWHWPLLILGATITDTQRPSIRIGLVALSLGVAYISWRYLETPLRRHRQLAARPKTTICVSVAIMLLAGSSALYWGTEADERAQSPRHLHYQNARTDAPDIYEMGCDDWYQSSEVKICSFGDNTANRTAVAIGDSIGLQWFPAYAEVFKTPEWQLLVITKSACPMVDAPLFYPTIGRMYTECAAWRESALDVVASLSPDVVVLGSTHTYGFSAAEWEEGTRRVVERLHANVDQIYVMRSTPDLPFDGPSCLEPRSSLHDRLNTGTSCTGPAYSERSKMVLESIKKAVTPFRNACIIDLNADVCPEGLCNAIRDGTPVFRDTQHLTATFTKKLSSQLDRQISQSCLQESSNALKGSHERH